MNSAIIIILPLRRVYYVYLYKVSNSLDDHTEIRNHYKLFLFNGLVSVLKKEMEI